MEYIYLPYSVYSHDRRQELFDLLKEMGYGFVKTYPDQKVTIRRNEDGARQ